MPRKGPAPKRPIDMDPVFGSQLVSQLVSKVLMDGKKQVAQRIVYSALEGTREKTGTDPVVTFVGVRDQRAAHDLERDGINRFGHAISSRCR